MSEQTRSIKGVTAMNGNRQGTEIVKSWYYTILDEAEEKLNDWERTFMESIRWKVDNHSVLTDRQYEKLESIYAEKTS